MLVAVSGIYSILSLIAGSACGYEYRTERFEVPVDHFSFSRNETFHMKYLINDTYWNKKTGPIFFYTGNEGAIELFANNSGFLWEIAPMFKAAVVFAEHRYYGDSMPFGAKSFQSPEFSGFLTSQQALADYVDLITHLRNNVTEAGKCPVIAFGGSYGGMLAAYIRMKYPHIVAGAVAASAPIWQFTGMTPCNVFYQIATSDFEVINKSCPRIIWKSWSTLRSKISTESGMAWLSKEWRMCKNITVKDVDNFISWLEDVYTNLAMANYPYPANFLAELPGHPVRAFCQQLRNSSASGDYLIRDLFGAVSIYFNYTGKAKCLDWTAQEQPDLGDRGWSYQSCTEMVMPMCPDGEKDMFEKSPWNFEEYSNECWKKWKVRPVPDLAEKIYGGKHIQDASNIVFSNGLLDPWASGGVLKTNGKNLVPVIIPEGAHHLDLRAKHKLDPGSVVQARLLYRRLIAEWIDKQFRDSN